ncbi:diguanylate cyclase (GGDEF) domain-containing protein [Pleurocapsa sp. PCC 7327]|uniref:EAL domain-containing protein n=1 Tax=Pleurocapsa sp. PCC 7327 TaxID=118163 RepID=UPI00029F830F|nr:EAL domain-containing protein [Pleurocapsa sp. PCC 7327]AFY77823.1 diguanylate cyclase (GGDEF) domain-containing protein [Pleurocapsa sp. PCC 7327]
MLTLVDNLKKVNHILVIDAPNLRRTVSLEQPMYSIGRQTSNSIVIFSQKLSRKHATILRKNENRDNGHSFCIIDGDLDGNKSKNSIFVNGRKCLEHELKHGDLINLSDDIRMSYYIINNSSNKLNVDRYKDSQIIPEKSTSFNISKEQFKQTQVIIKNEIEEDNNYELTKLASLVELSPNPIIEIDWEGQITYLNSAASLKFSDIYKTKLEHPILKDLLEKNQHRNGNLLIREVKVEEEVFEQHVHYLSESKLIRSYIFDITERKRIEEILQYQAFHDALTELPNRSLFHEQLALAIANAHRNQTQMAVIFLDLDCFKNINDTLGHSIGDRILQLFAKRLNACLREGDTIARWGGDEFTILLPHIKNIEEAAKLAERLLGEIKQPFEVDEHKLYVKSSLGIAIYPQDGEDPETLLKNADAALYRGKEQGRDRYQFYSSTMTSKVSEWLRLEHLLHQALANEELFLVYQPQLDIESGKIFGMEALLRWHNPELGLVSPAKFIPLAEDNGLIVPIGEWVLKSACAQIKAWQLLGIEPFKVSVNLSARQFQNANLVEMVTQILQETEIDPQWLELEITETIIMQNVNFARRALERLQQIGVRISLDDFGTGYSSLSYLKQFPFHTLKIDQSFVRDLKENSRDTAIISAVIALGRGLNLRVIAEGVETQQQLELLRNLQCEAIQGYWLSKPLIATEVVNFLTCHTKMAG